MAAVAITRLEPSSAELRRLVVRSGDRDVIRRLLTLALALEGWSREATARSCGKDRQTLRDWVHRYNAQGVAGLRDRKASGAKPKQSAEQEAKVIFSNGNYSPYLPELIRLYQNAKHDK